MDGSANGAKAARSNHLAAGRPHILIVGTGFGGIGLGIALKKAGIHEFEIFERAADLGGVWRDNTYPGAACDVPSSFYSYSFEPDYPWSSRFGSQAEILAYLRLCVNKYDLARHIRNDTEITEASFDESAGVWTLVSGAGQRFTAPVVVSAVGLFSHPLIPALPGIDRFAGDAFHSSRWRHDIDLTGKTVAVIGTGASAIQIVPAIAGAVRQLYVFQRSAPYVVPKFNPPMPPVARRFAHLRRKLERFRTYLGFEMIIPRRASERLTAKGERAFRTYLESQVPDPALRRKLTPRERLGCKRVLQSSDWYPTLQRPNVEVVDTGIAAVEPEGIRTDDGATRAVDVIVYATGFTASDILPMRVTGLGGRELRTEWRDGAEAYLGTTIAGFPNFFMLFGPNTNVPGSIVYMIECQTRYILSCLRALKRRSAKSMMPREDVQRRFNADLAARIANTTLVRDGCRSYFMAASGKITTQWPGFMAAFRRRTARVNEADYEFFGCSR